MPASSRASRRSRSHAAGKPHVALVLQGGGALGAYHIGAYQALQEADFEPDWIAGISIGAINSAVLAGNRPEHRLAALESLWEEISRPSFGFGFFGLDSLPLPVQRGANTISSFEAFTLGQPHFFYPRFPNPLVVPPGNVGDASFYDTTPMLDTLAERADFALINSGEIRLSLGATDVESGELVFFDNTREALTPAHVLASGSLPPGFPATQVGDHWYWDGGCVSNTPLEAIMNDLPAGPMLVFAVDLWSAAGNLPATMDDVAWRQKEIQYASRTAQHIRTCAHTINMCRTLHDKAEEIDTSTLALPYASALKFEDTLDIVHITYRPTGDQVSTSDVDFSRVSIAERRAAGYADMRAALKASPWQARARAPQAAAVHRVRNGSVTGNVSLM